MDAKAEAEHAAHENHKLTFQGSETYSLISSGVRYASSTDKENFYSWLVHSRSPARPSAESIRRSAMPVKKQAVIAGRHIIAPKQVL